MLFTSANYFIFLAIVFFGYCLLARKRVPVWFLLASSYYFYALWNPKFLGLVVLISTVDFLVAMGLGRTDQRALRQLLVSTSILIDAGVLFVFKYFNFFSASLTELLAKAGWHAHAYVLRDLILPLGLSFITFRSLSYVVDVYRKQLQPTTHYLDYLTFVAFFPSVIAGPIVRAGDLLPQFRSRPDITSEQGNEAIFLIMLGLIKKIAIADFLGNNLVDRVFDQPQLYSSLETLAAIYGYAVQIYCDFSGYSDIAIGSALLLGFKLPLNFVSPYRARDLRDFWRRWHISLSTWLFDYVYVSIGGLRKRRFNLYRNLVITFLIGGLWHGAAWTFVVWGGMHGLGLCATHWWSSFRKRTKSKSQPRWWSKVIGVFLTFHFVCLTWIVFRATTLDDAWQVLRRLGAMQFAMGNLSISILVVLGLAYLSHWLPGNISTRTQKIWTWLPAPVQAVLILSLAAGLYYVAGAEAQFIYGNF
ncbi:MAG TPA: MBOAT family protein [Pyrinomonadaceae bacterium]|jgi:D-alanyl-lipoteichoic acid acyltransferase DltB (MBOAT superfamily)|nr:MBOAT family protein [Pyrinomonadaceae bacterium]